MKPILLIAAIAALPFLPALPAQAQAQENVRVVSTAGLDLRRESDVRRLDRRIAAAAASVCGAMSDAHPSGKNAVHRCRREAAANADAARARAIASQVRTEPVTHVAAQ